MAINDLAIEEILADPVKLAAAVERSGRMLERAIALKEQGVIERFYPVVYLDDMRIIERIELVFLRDGELVAERLTQDNHHG